MEKKFINKINSGNRFTRNFRKPEYQEELSSAILSRRKVSKTRAGGRRQGFSVLMAVGNKKGKIGVGSARALYYNEAIQKAERRAKKNLMTVPLLHNRTIPHNIAAKLCSTSVLVHQAKPGRGIVAGGCLWHIFSLLGIKDVVCKCIGASNSNHNMVYSLIKALKSIETLDDIAKRRNISTKSLLEKKATWRTNV